VNNVKEAFNELNTKVQPMIGSAKTYATKQTDEAGDGLIFNGEDLLAAVGKVRCAIEPPPEPDFPSPPSPPPPHVEDTAPVCPPPPVDPSPPPIPPPPEEEFPSSDEDVDQEIYLPAKELFEEVNKWMAKGNSLIDAAKRMALLMAEMSRLVQEGGNKGELIRCAQEIVKYGQLVAKLSREIADKCTDRRIKNNMSGSSQNIETIATQFRILSTVKATMLNARDVSDDEAAQAHEMLVHNAQNLMRYVKEVVREANAANIKIRADSGLTIKWIPKDQKPKKRRNRSKKSTTT
jgi:vinculin